MAAAPSHSLAAALAAALSASLQAELPDLAARTATEDAAGAGWRMHVSVSGPLEGLATLWMDRDGAAALVSQLPGSTPEPDEDAVATRLGELLATVIAAVAPGPGLQDLVLQPAAVEAGGPPDATTTMDFISGDARVRVAAAASLRALASDAETAPPHGQSHIEALLDIDLPLVVRFARTTMSIKTLSSVGPGTVVDMERGPDAPVEILVGDRVIAEGEVVVVSGNYGVRVTKLCNPASRVRSVEA